MSPSDEHAVSSGGPHHVSASPHEARPAPTSPASSSSHHAASPSQARTPSSTASRSTHHRGDAADPASDAADRAEASSSGAAAVPLAGKRSRSGCLTCRKRKKKCDETLCEETGGCWRCRNAGYRCEGFRRPPVVFAPGTSATTKHKRIKISSPETGADAGIKTEPASSHAADWPDANVVAHPRTSESRQQDGMVIGNSLAEFAGLATSSAAWPLAATSKAEAKPPMPLRNGTAASPPALAPLAPASAMLPPQTRSPLRSGTEPEPVHAPPATAASFYSAAQHGAAVACEIVGDCLFSGRHLCASCSAVANRLMQPDAAQLAAMDAHLVQVQPMPSLSTPMASRHHSPAPAGAGEAHSSAQSRLVMESLIGYYSTLITCWTQGCDVRGLEASTLFRQLVPYLLDSVDSHPPLRLSIAAVTAGYVGGARLTWPKDVVAIHQWANTLRADRTSIADCVRANLNFPFPSTPDTVWSASPATSVSEAAHTALGPTALSPANAERLRRASTTHATLDDLLVGQAQTLKQLAVRSLEQAVADYRCKTATTRAAGVGFTEKGFLAELAQVNPLLLAAMNIAIYAFAEEGMESYFEEAARMRALIDTLLGAFPPVDLGKLVSHEVLGFRTYVWSDVSTAIACGTRPHLQLALSTYASEEADAQLGGEAGEGGEGEGEAGALEMTFGLQDASLIALSDIARLRYDYDGGDFAATATRAAGTPVPQWVHERAKRIQTRAESCRIGGSLTTGSAICAMMTKSACVVLIYTLIYRVGALHPVVRSLLRGMLELWTRAGEQYCRSVGCSNFNLPIFIAASVAVDEEDRRVCEQAMQIVGHEEAGPAPGRQLIREVWRRTDITGLPCFWTDLVATGDYAVAFF